MKALAAARAGVEQLCGWALALDGASFPSGCQLSSDDFAELLGFAFLMRLVHVPGKHNQDLLMVKPSSRTVGARCAMGGGAWWEDASTVGGCCKMRLNSLAYRVFLRRRWRRRPLTLFHRKRPDSGVFDVEML